MKDAVKTRDAYTSNKIRLSRFGLVLGLSERVRGARDVYTSKTAMLTIIHGKPDRTIFHKQSKLELAKISHNL